MSRLLVNQWLHTLGSALSQPLSLDDRGALGLELQSGLHCVLELDPDQQDLMLHGDLMDVDPSRVASICQHAMEKNLYGMASYGMTLGFDSARSVLVASINYPLSMLSEESFAVHLERFISGFEQLHHDFRNLDSGLDADGRRA